MATTGIGSLELPLTDHPETDEPGPPSEENATLALKIIERLPDLLEQGVQALWHDLTATGSVRSGMWWHGGLDEAFERSEVTPTDATGLYAAMRPHRIAVSRYYALNAPAARIQFHAEFEEEHGVSFLTDGAAIIGVGYDYDSSPFSST